jgi:hypothetical protein
MADFDQSTAASRHKWIIEEVQAIRDGITNDVINYYYDAPTSADEEREKREGMRKFLRAARDRIDDLLGNQLAD